MKQIIIFTQYQHTINTITMMPFLNIGLFNHICQLTNHKYIGTL